MYTPEQQKLNIKSKMVDSALSQKSGDIVGTYYLADNPQYYEPQRPNNFKFYIEGLSSSLNIQTNDHAKKNADQVIEISVKSSSVPHFTISPITIKRGNSSMKFAGTPEFKDGSISLIDYIGAGTKDILLAWQRKAYNVDTEKVGLATDYKRDGYLVEYTPEYQVVRSWKLHGCWIGGLEEDDYNHDNGSQVKTLNATIHYDKATVDSIDLTQ